MMNKELKKEAIQYAVDYPTSYGKGYKHKDLRIAYLAGAEPREKRITHLMASLADVSVKSALRIVALEKQLDKSKALLAKWVELYKPKVGNIPPTPIQVNTEQFLKELSK